MTVGWAPNTLEADPNGSGVNRLDTDDILAPHNKCVPIGQKPLTQNVTFADAEQPRTWSTRVPLEAFIRRVQLLIQSQLP